MNPAITPDDAQAIVEQLEQARVARSPMRIPTALHPDLTLDDAYAIQHAWTRLRLGQGRQRIGYKIAMSSPGTQRAMAIDRPAYGVLLDDMRFASGDPIAVDGFIKPRLELELAFVMKHDLVGPCSVEDALAAVDRIVPAVEIVDSRVRFTDPETGRARAGRDIVADGGATAGLVLFDAPIDPAQTDLGRVAVTLDHDGAIEDSGVFAVVFGAPERALPWLAGELASHGDRIRAGDVILCGSAIKAFAIAPGDRFGFHYLDIGRFELCFI